MSQGISAVLIEKPRYSAIMPCLNEERTLAICIAKARAALDRLGGGEIVVADNGSTDSSVAVALSLGARVIHVVDKGYGAALLAGFRGAEGDIMVMADSDDSYDWNALDTFVHKIEEGYDLVMGNRFAGGIDAGAMPPLHRYLGNPVLSFMARLFFRTTIRDFHCGMRGLTKSAFERLRLKTTGMEFATEMVANAACQQMRIAQIPTPLHKDGRDRPPHLRSFRDGWRHLRFMLMYAPDHLFLLPGFLLLLGLPMLIYLVPGPQPFLGLVLGIHFVALSSMMTLMGVTVIAFGVLAKYMTSRKFPFTGTAFSRYISQHFKVEHGLLAGLALSATGVIIDAWIASRWLSHFRQPMADTIHLSLFATTLAACGIIIMFASFLMALMKDMD